MHTLTMLVIKNKILYELWHNCNSHGNNIEHNMGYFFERCSIKSIIGKSEHNRPGPTFYMYC